MIELLRKEHAVNSGDIISIEAEVPQITFDFAGGGAYGSLDKVVRIKEQADHDLRYLLAVALLDGDVMPAQSTPERISKEEVQTLLKKVVIRPNQEYT